MSRSAASARLRSRPSTHPVISGPSRAWPPGCVLRQCDPDAGCDFVGAPDDRQTPYLACGGNLARHQRTPVGDRR